MLVTKKTTVFFVASLVGLMAMDPVLDMFNVPQGGLTEIAAKAAVITLTGVVVGTVMR